MKKFMLFKIGALCGIIPITLELIMALSRWIASSFFAFDLHHFQIFRTVIVFLYIPIAFIGLIILVLFLIKNKTKWYLFITGTVIVLSNFPLLLSLRTWEMKFDSRAYIRITNASNINFISVNFIQPDSSCSYGRLQQKEKKIFFYYPNYRSGIGDNCFLLLTKDSAFKLESPIIHPGEFERLIITKKLQLERE